MRDDFHVFFLNPKAKFHDGTLITREDILFSLETFQTKGTPNQKKTYGKVIKTKLVEENGFTVLSYEVHANVGGKVAQLGSRLIDGVAKKMSDYFIGRFADLVAPIVKEEKESGMVFEERRVKEIKSNFLNKYIYAVITILILLLVAIFYYVSR